VEQLGRRLANASDMQVEPIFRPGEKVPEYKPG